MEDRAFGDGRGPPLRGVRSFPYERASREARAGTSPPHGGDVRPGGDRQELSALSLVLRRHRDVAVQGGSVFDSEPADLDLTVQLAGAPERQALSCSDVAVH